MDDCHVRLSLNITEDQGRGSIFENIEKINDYITSRLHAKINLTKKTQMEPKLDMKASMEEKLALQANQMVKWQDKKAQMKMEADKLLLSSVEQIELAVTEKFSRAEKDINERLYILV